MKFYPNQFLGFNLKKLLLYYFYTKFGIFKYYLKYVLPNRKILNKTLKLKNSKKGKKVFIFGSGPSMSLLDPKKISELINKEGYDVIALNSFLYTDFAKFITPSYMVFSDPIDFRGELPSTHARKHREVGGREDKKKAIKKNIPLIIPIQFFEYTKQDHGQVFYFNDCSDYFSEKIDLLKPRPFKSFTGMKAIASGIYMGYDEIYICGFDYEHFKKTTVDEDNQISFEFKHFYESKNRPHHNLSIKKYTFGHHLYDCALAFIQHDKFKNFNIVNLHKNSLIDSFPKNKNLNIYLKDKV
jgi:hypothetical protein